MSQVIPFSEACERNKDVILDVIAPYLQRVDSVLEIGTGTAQHALHFARANPQLDWQTSDQREYLGGIMAQLENARQSNAPHVNVLPPIELDVNQPIWVPSGTRYPIVFTANTFHIMSIVDVEAFFMGLADVVSSNAHLIIYGPFKYQGKFTSGSNADFDQSLRSRGVGSCIKDFETVRRLASSAGFGLHTDHRMPANNQCLIFSNVP